MTPLPLGSPVLRKILDRISEASKREEAALIVKDRQRDEREALDEKHRFERELFERR